MKTVVGLAAAAVMAAATAVAFAHRTPPPLAPTSIGIKELHFNTLAQSEQHTVAAGALGNIFVSSDQGQQWSSAKIDQQRNALLVEVTFAKDKKTGFAVGHEGWILRTTDGGASWQEVHFDEKHGEPLMSIAQLPGGEWLSVGAFGRALISKDGGDTWERMQLPDAVEDKHMNRITSSEDGQQLAIVGERGLVLLSQDGGATWQAEEPFYNGSLYNIMPLGQGGWLAYGMRGNIFAKPSAEAAWAKSNVPASISFFNHTQRADGAIVLVGQGSMLGISRDNGQTFALQKVPGRAAFMDVLRVSPDKTLLASESGLSELPALNAIAAASAAAPAGVAQ